MKKNGAETFRMGVQIEDHRPKRINVARRVEPEGVKDSYDFFILTCDGLNESGQVKYWVRGFGDNSGNGGWYVDASYLSCVLEDIGRGIDRLVQDDIAVLDFYEQAHQRQVRFSPVGQDRVEVECETHLKNWSPKPTQYTQPLSLVMSDMMQVVAGYVRGLQMLLPEFMNAPVLRKWVEEPGPRLALLSYCPRLSDEVFKL